MQFKTQKIINAIILHKIKITRRKVERAKELLRSTPDSVSAIASALGFLDVSYFVKLFKRFEGVTPLTYRKLKRSSSAAPSLGKI